MYSNVKQTKDQIVLPELDYVLKENCIFIDSRDRDRNLYPNTNEFVVHFNDAGIIGDTGAVINASYRDVHSIELVQCVLPQVVIGITGVPYLTLEIPELDNTFQGTNDTLSKAFGYLSPQDVYGTTHLSTKFYRRCKKVFNPIKGSLGKITLRFRRPNGELYDFGADTSAGSPVNEAVQVLLYFDIHTRERKQRHSVHFR
jgi:hypothetical protein